MSATLSEVETDLDWISRGIVIAISENGGSSTTSKIKTNTGVTEGTKVPYRLKNKLAPAGLVELTRPGMDENGQTLPLKVTLTDQGRELAQQLDEYEDVAETPDVTEYTDKLEAKLNRLQSRVADLEEMMQELNETLQNRQQIDDQVADSLEELDGRLQDVEQRVAAQESTSSGGKQ